MLTMVGHRVILIPSANEVRNQGPKGYRSEKTIGETL
jgi:hypothetical protein